MATAAKEPPSSALGEPRGEADPDGERHRAPFAWPARLVPARGLSQPGSLCPSQTKFTIYFMDGEHLTIALGFRLLLARRPFAQLVTLLFVSPMPEDERRRTHIPRPTPHVPGRRPSRVHVVQEAISPSLSQLAAYPVALKSSCF